VLRAGWRVGEAVLRTQEGVGGAGCRWASLDVGGSHGRERAERAALEGAGGVSGAGAAAGAREGAVSGRRCGRERVARGMQRRRRVRGRGNAGSGEGERGGGGARADAASWSERGGGALRAEGAGARGVAGGRWRRGCARRVGAGVVARGGMEVGGGVAAARHGRRRTGVAVGCRCRGGMEVGGDIVARAGWRRAAAARAGWRRMQRRGLVKLTGLVSG
jgi:hypothetical protein